MMKIIFFISIKQPFFPYHIWEEYVNLFMEKNMGTQKKYLNFQRLGLQTVLVDDKILSACKRKPRE